MKRVSFLVLYLSLIACSTSNNSNDNFDVKNDNIHFTVKINLNFEENSIDNPYDDQVIIKLPKSYTESGKPTRLVYLAHGAGGGVTDSIWFLEKYSLDDTLLANGYAVFDVNGGPNFENMGGMYVVRSAYNTYEFIKENYNVYDEIFVIGLSMGGLSSTNFVYKHSNIVLAHGMYSPVLDLYKQPWSNPWYPTTKKSIAEAYNFDDKSGDTWEQDRVEGWNPLLNRTTVNNADTIKSYPVPVKIWHGIGDELVRVNSSREFNKYIQNGGGSSELIEIDSDDHGLSCGNPEMNYEMIEFLKENENL